MGEMEFAQKRVVEAVEEALIAQSAVYGEQRIATAGGRFQEE